MNLLKFIIFLIACMGSTIFFGMIYSIGILWIYIKNKLSKFTNDYR